jgi:beta-glucosidase/6-phospho-beta-glucosidase/beta-galactosidase
MLKPDKLEAGFNTGAQRFLFATGIECSYPTIQTPQGVKRQDELAKCRHYEYWQEDLRLTREMGIRYLRYGPPWYRLHTGPGRYDWDWTDMALSEMQKLGIIPIMDLCHFGVPDWLQNFQNPEFPRYFAEYARAFAERYAWVRLYTPVNEMFVAAEFSGWYGMWNERLRSDRAFVTALKHLARANREGMVAILEVRPDALFIQSESSEYTHTTHPHLEDRAAFFNQRRFLALDLNYGHQVDAAMYCYLRDNGVTDEEYRYFMERKLREHCIMGNDYYVTNEHMLIEENQSVSAGETFGYYVVTQEYYRRYNLPMMHTETNNLSLPLDQAVRWLWKTWINIQRLRKDGVPMIGMTWFSLTDQVDWDTALQEDNGNVNPIGLYDLNRNIRPVGKAYQHLIREWSAMPILPNGPLTLIEHWKENLFSVTP